MSTLASTRNQTWASSVYVMTGPSELQVNMICREISMGPTAHDSGEVSCQGVARQCQKIWWQHLHQRPLLLPKLPRSDEAFAGQPQARECRALHHSIVDCLQRQVCPGFSCQGDHVLDVPLVRLVEVIWTDFAVGISMVEAVQKSLQQHQDTFTFLASLPNCLAKK